MDLYNRKRQFERAVRNIEESDEIKINNKKKIHFFELSIHYNQLVKFPKSAWDGKDFSNNKKNFVTEINIKLLVDLVEERHIN